MEAPERVHGLGFALIVAGVSMAWFGAGALLLVLFGWMCSLNPPVCTDSAMNYLPEILLVSVGGGMIGTGLYVWFSTRPPVWRRIEDEERSLLPGADRLQRIAEGLLIMGGVGSLGTWVFVHSILWGWHPGGLLEALEVILFYPPPLVFGVGLVLLAIAAFA